MEKTYLTKVKEKLEALKPNENFSKKEFIKEVWGRYDFFLDRNFSVFFANAKKLLLDKEFRTIKGMIVRTK